MRIRYDFTCTAYAPESGREAFPASIPGNLQADLLAAYPDFCPDPEFADNSRALIPTEEWTWVYTLIPPKIAPITMESPRRRPVFVTDSVIMIAAQVPVKAPMLIKPACPRLSSPRIPTVRFSEIAITIYAQIGTSIPCMERVIFPVEERIIMIA